MIRLTIDYGWAGCHETFDIDEFDDDASDEAIEDYCSEFARDEIFSKVEWNWERVDDVD